VEEEREKKLDGKKGGRRERKARNARRVGKTFFFIPIHNKKAGGSFYTDSSTSATRSSRPATFTAKVDQG
jgi:hypothetical protein